MKIVKHYATKEFFSFFKEESCLSIVKNVPMLDFRFSFALFTEKGGDSYTLWN